MKHTKDGKNLNALLRRAMLGVLDIMLFALANCSICYLTMSGHIMATDYKYMIFNYLHFGLTSVLLVGINSAFGLYRSVWYFAGSDEIVKSFLGALVNAVQLFLCDRLLFAKLLHTKGYLPYYAYILFFVLMFVATLIPRIGYRILRRYVHNLVGRRDGQKRIMIVGAGFMGNFIIDDLRNDHYREGRPVIALDDNPAKYKKRINGVKIVGICDDLPRLTEKYKIDEIIFCIPSAAPARRQNPAHATAYPCKTAGAASRCRGSSGRGGPARRRRRGQTPCGPSHSGRRPAPRPPLRPARQSSPAYCRAARRE